MRRTKSILLALTVVSCLIIFAGPASADWLFDLYAGGAITNSNDVTNKTTFGGGAVTDTLKDVGFDTSASFGGRLGYWFESVPYVGLAIDAFHFQPDISPQTVDFSVRPDVFGESGRTRVEKLDIQVTALSFDLMLRWPMLKNTQFPKGQLQPYLTAGPAVFFSRAKDSSDTGNFTPPKQSDTDTSVGVKAAAGVAWQFHKNVALFAEYRFTHFSPDFEFKDTDPRTSAPTKARSSLDINTNHFLAGISFRF